MGEKQEKENKRMLVTMARVMVLADQLSPLVRNDDARHVALMVCGLAPIIARATSNRNEADELIVAIGGYLARMVEEDRAKQQE